MMNTYQNISTLIPSQLPAYIRDDPAYSNFITFFQAYYEWMEQENNPLYKAKNLLNYNDIDTTTSEFLSYFVNDFLQHFPKDSLITEQLALKTAKELYRTKGTPASYQFLFRILYDSDFDIFYTKDAILKASSGVWYVPTSLKLATEDLAFLNIQNMRIFGETSKSIATIENSVVSGTKMEVFISNIERLFTSGEIVKIVDANSQDLYFLNGKIVYADALTGIYPVGSYILQAKLVGQISQINIDPNARGLYYNPGDPIIVYGGLNSTVGNPIGATAEVGTTTAGSIKSISIVKNGFGFRQYPNTQLVISDSKTSGAIAIIGPITTTLPPTPTINNGGTGYLVGDSVVSGNSTSYIAFADVNSVSQNGSILGITYRSGLDPNTIFGISATVISSNTLASNASISISTVLGSASANVTRVISDTIDLKIQGNYITLGSSSNTSPYYFNRMPTANYNTKLSDAFTFQAFATGALSSVIVENGGGGMSTLPTVTAESFYNTDVYNPTDSSNTLGNNIQGNLATLGILSPIQIVNPGVGYRANDVINISGGSGYGANAVVTKVSSTGGMISISYTYPSSVIEYPLGGMGYKITSLPTAIPNSSNVSAHGASLLIPGILGTGAEFSVATDRIGSITTINVLTYGEDYISAPNVSLKVQDIVVANASIINLPQNGDILYQGSSINTATYVATVDSIQELTFDTVTQQSLFNLRVFNYTSTIIPNQLLKIKNKQIYLNAANTAYTKGYFYNGSPVYDSLGTISYGDGNAKANSKFLNGLTVGSGQYLTSQGQPSGFSVLQNETYNNYTYQITVEKEISKYRDVLLNLLHPTGMKVIGRYAIKTNSSAIISATDTAIAGRYLPHYTGTESSNVSMSVISPAKSTNIVKFGNLAGANLASFIFPNTTLAFTTSYGDIVRSEVTSVQANTNSVTLAGNVWLSFANVATISANAGSNTVVVNSLTGAYNIINNGKYTNANVPLMDIIRTGDLILIPNNIVNLVSAVDYTNNLIYLNSPISQNANNLMMSVNRTLNASDNGIQLYNPAEI